MGEFEQLEAVGVIKLPSKLRSVKHLKAYLQVHLALDSPIRSALIYQLVQDGTTLLSRSPIRVWSTKTCSVTTSQGSQGPTDRTG